MRMELCLLSSSVSEKPLRNPEVRIIGGTGVVQRTRCAARPNVLYGGQRNPIWSIEDPIIYTKIRAQWDQHLGDPFCVIFTIIGSADLIF